MGNRNAIETFKKNLVSIRKERGLSQRDLAKKMGTTQRVIAYYEREASNIPLAKLQLLAKVLGVTISRLLSGVDGRKSQVQDLDIRIVRKIKQVEQLPRRSQEALWHTINTALQMNELKNKKRKAKAG